MRIESDLKLDYSDVLIRPRRSDIKSRGDVSLKTTLSMLHGATDYNVVPIIASNMTQTGTISMMQSLAEFDMPTAIHKNYDNHKIEYLLSMREMPFYGWWPLGMCHESLNALWRMHIQTSKVDNICIDVANGNTKQFYKYVKTVRERFPNSRIMAGNVATPELTQDLLRAGADIVKIGIGSGSVCLTRSKTGVGYPQLSATYECAQAADEIGGLICADGGCTTAGDIAKAFGAGAAMVMLGGMLAGHDECEGILVNDMVKFHGMSSSHAQSIPEYATEEGKEVLIPYRGPVADTVKDILGGLRSSCTYVGAQSLDEMHSRTTFIRVNNQLNNIFS